MKHPNRGVSIFVFLFRKVILMSKSSLNNIRLAKNSLYLYFRMFIVLAIGLFTSRVLLDALGVDDFGINNLVAGFVTMFWELM